jgi:hypothetical protein
MTVRAPPLGGLGMARPIDVEHIEPRRLARWHTDEPARVTAPRLA